MVLKWNIETFYRQPNTLNRNISTTERGGKRYNSRCFYSQSQNELTGVKTCVDISRYVHAVSRKIRQPQRKYYNLKLAYHHKNIDVNITIERLSSDA